MGEDQHPHHRYPSAVPVKEGGGGCVVVTPEHGPKEEYYGFVGEAQALSWIQKEIHLRPNAKGADPKATWRKKPGEYD